ncbi:MAG: YbhB/YbcL family Raf kinase inhibitor-like protein [Propionibacteriaceae bacterium]|nr:YbhB/YbcL family Raf kinase inhibitor-like protein [Propionibacteriaceae bacterium]
MAIDLKRPVAPDPYTILPSVAAFTLTSSDFSAGQALAGPQTAEGGGISPQLSWSGFPEQTASFLLTCYDPDAPREGGFWHWVVADIPPNVTSIPEGVPVSMMKALANRFFRPPSSIGVTSALDLPNTAGTSGYIGAAPPKGDRVHRYFFAVHALNVEQLSLPHGRRTAPALVSATAIPYTIARGVLVGTCQR